MKSLAVILSVSLTLAAVSSCRLLNSILHDDEVVAKVGNEMLYKSDVDALIPDGTSSDDSLRLAMQYINTWASDIVFLDIAEAQLSKTEKDVSKELESYRRSLLKYRYEQQYINERLDTAVTETEINDYYSAHADNFVLRRPIVKARYLKILPGSPNLRGFKSLMSSGEEDALWQAENLASASADIFTGYGDRWIDLSTLARDMGMEEEKLLASGQDKFVEVQDGGGMLNIAYIVELIEVGKPAPVDYCSSEIIDMIISTRKRRLLSSLEQELLTSARDKGKFVIY